MPSLAEVTSGARGQLTDLFELFGGAPRDAQGLLAAMKRGGGGVDPAQVAMGFSPLGMAGAVRPVVGGVASALREQMARVAAGPGGEQKYAMLKDLARKLRELEGVPEAGPTSIPADVVKNRMTMEGILDATAKRFTMKD